jgi:hypothetical protein
MAMLVYVCHRISDQQGSLRHVKIAALPVILLRKVTCNEEGKLQCLFLV